MKFKNLIVSLLVVFSGLFCVAQDYTIVEKNGEKCYSHKVEAGHTLYAIATLYDSEEEIIVEYNKEILAGGLKVGQTIFIPVSTNFVPGEVKNPIRIEEGFLIHKVMKKETLFSICQTYNVDINDVSDLNPGVNSGLRKGQELKIPVNNVDSAMQVAPPVDFEPKKWVQHKVLPGETLYGVSKKYEVSIQDIHEINDLPEGLKAGETINIPILKEQEDIDSSTSVSEVITEWEEKKDNPYRDQYNVALALPFYLSKLDTGDISAKNERVRRVALSFYRGAMMAAETLEKEGLSMNLEVMSVSNNKNQLRLLASDPKIHQMDMFIGPFQKEALKKVIEISEGSGAPVICPTPQSGSMLLSNENVFKVIPSGSTLMESVAKEIAERSDRPNVILIQTDWVNDKRRQQVLKKHIIG